jgi:hypothetical protein
VNIVPGIDAFPFRIPDLPGENSGKPLKELPFRTMKLKAVLQLACGISSAVQGGFFLGKKPLSG